MGIHKLIILQVEPGDDTCHIDGMVRFLDENKVVVGDYPADIPGKPFLDHIATKLDEDFNLKRVMNEPPQEKGQERVTSIAGNYVNFIRVGDIIFLPQYGNEYDEKARKTFEKYYCNIVPINHDIEKLAELGGVLNCMTWEY